MTREVLVEKVKPILGEAETERFMGYVDDVKEKGYPTFCQVGGELQLAQMGPRQNETDTADHTRAVRWSCGDPARAEMIAESLIEYFGRGPRSTTVSV